MEHVEEQVGLGFGPDDIFCGHKNRRSEGMGITDGNANRSRTTVMSCMDARDRRHSRLFAFLCRSNSEGII